VQNQAFSGLSGNLSYTIILTSLLTIDDELL
jgi:hypothetical protein